MTDRETTLLNGRIKRIQQILGRSLTPATPSSGPPLEMEERDHLIEAAEDLYWNELEWEKLTGEERLDQEFLTELAFPGFLAFIRGLLLTEAMPDSPVPPRPSPEVVQDVLAFLTGRIVELEEQSSSAEGEDREHREIELDMTSRLVDLVLYRLLELGPDEVEAVEATLSPE
jgi:hypothetical protein